MSQIDSMGWRNLATVVLWLRSRLHERVESSKPDLLTPDDLRPGHIITTDPWLNPFGTRHAEYRVISYISQEYS